MFLSSSPVFLYPPSSQPSSRPCDDSHTPLKALFLSVSVWLPRKFYTENWILWFSLLSSLGILFIIWIGIFLFMFLKLNQYGFQIWMFSYFLIPNFSSNQTEGDVYVLILILILWNHVLMPKFPKQKTIVLQEIPKKFLSQFLNSYLAMFLKIFIPHKCLSSNLDCGENMISLIFIYHWNQNKFSCMKKKLIFSMFKFSVNLETDINLYTLCKFSEYTSWSKHWYLM